MPITERLILPTHSGVEFWKEPVKTFLQTLKKQEGCMFNIQLPYICLFTNLSTSPQISARDGDLILRMLITWSSWSVRSQFSLLVRTALTQSALRAIGWESEEANRKFQASADFAQVMETLKPILTGKPSVYFMEFKPYAPKEVIDAPFVEMLTFSPLDDGITEDQARSAVETYKTVEGCTGVASGLSTAGVESADGKKVFVAVIGWQSLELSAAGNASKALSITGKSEKHHVNFRYPVKVKSNIL